MHVPACFVAQRCRHCATYATSCIVAVLRQLLDMPTIVHVLLCHSKSCLELVNFFTMEKVTENDSCTKEAHTCAACTYTHEG